MDTMDIHGNSQIPVATHNYPDMDGRSGQAEGNRHGQAGWAGLSPSPPLRVHIHACIHTSTLTWAAWMDCRGGVSG